MTIADQQAGRPLPSPSPLSRHFWEGTKRGVLLVQRCRRCGGYEWTPQMACSRCLEEILEWVPVSGRGTVYSYSVVHRPQGPAFVAPYVVAIVELAEGPHMLSDLIDVATDEVRIGMAVEVAFEDVGEVALYHFRPAAAHPATEAGGDAGRRGTS